MKLKKIFSSVLAAAVIFGSANMSCLAASSNEYTVNGIEILSESYTPLKSIAYSDTVGIHASITKNTYSDTSALTAIASYNQNGSLAELKTFRQSGFSAGQTVGIYTTLTALCGGKIKTFVWDNINSASPLSNAAVKEFSDFPTLISYDDTSDRIRIRGTVGEISDGKAKITLSEKYDGDICAWQTASGTITVDTGDYTLTSRTEAELMICGYPTSNKILAVNENYGTAENLMLMSVRNEYYEINDITLTSTNGNALTTLAKGSVVHGGAYFTRIDASTFKEPYLLLELRGGDGEFIDSVIVSTDEMYYNQTAFASFMFTVPDNFENCYITANIYDDTDCATALSAQTKKSLTDLSTGNISKSTIKIKGRFNEKSDTTVTFTVDEACVPINGVKRWTTDFTDYISNVCTITLGDVNVDDMLGYAALLDVEISDNAIILKNAEIVEDGGYIDIPDDSETLTPAVSADYTQALGLLSALGMTDGENLDKPLTRGMLAELLCKMGGYGEYAASSINTNAFADVDAGTMLNGFCVTADELGYITKYSNGAFKPDSIMKYSDILTSILNMLGYTDVENPVAKALTLGLNLGVTAGKDNSLTKGTALVLLYNALETPMVEKTSTGYSSVGTLPLNKLNIVKFEGTVYETPLSSDTVRTGKIKVKYERQITAVKDSFTAQRYYMAKAEEDANPSDVYGSLQTDDRFKKATINVADDIKAAAESYLDYNVVMYVENATDSDATLVAVYPKASKNSDVTFKTKDLYMSGNKTSYYADGDYISGTIAAYTNKSTGTYEKYDVEISKVYVNGREQDLDGTAIYGTYTRKNILDKYINDDADAEVKLLSNTSGSVYNIVYITSYLDIVVETINEKTTTIAGKSADTASNLISKVVFDEDEYGGRYSFVKDGQTATFADIQKGDVLSIAGYVNSNKELEYGVVTIVSEKASGSVSTYDEDDKTITVGGKTYDYNSYIGGKVGQVGTSGIKLGDEVTLYINARGYVVDIDKTASKQNLKYGFVTKIVKSTGVEDSWQVRLLTTDGTWETFNLASKVTFDGVQVSSISHRTADDMVYYFTSANVADDLTSTPTKEHSTKVYKNGVIAYETNSDGEINKIYVTANTDTDEAFTYAKIDDKEYIEATESLGSVYLSDDTVIFTYASGSDLTGVIDEDDISVAKKDALVNRSEYAARAYGVDNYGYAKVICGEGLIGEIPLNGDFFVISNKASKANADGDEGYELTGFVGGEEIALFAEKGEVEVNEFTGIAADGKTPTTTWLDLDDLNKGDVILYSRTVNGDADRIIRLVDAESLKDSSTANGLKPTDGKVFVAQFEAAGDDYSFYYGFAYGRSGNILKLSAKGEWDENDEVATVNLSAKSDVLTTNVDMYSGRYTVSAATADDIYCDSTGSGKGDMVFIRTVNDVVADEIVIYKHAETAEIEQPEPEPEPVQPIDVEYGFVTKIVKSTGVTDVWQLRMLKTDGKWATFTLASKVAFDGVQVSSISSKSADDMVTYFTSANVYDDGTNTPTKEHNTKVYKNGVIAYKTNSDGEINKIYVTADTDTDEAFTYANIYDKKYIEATESLGSVCLNDDTVIFSYKTGSDLTRAIDEDDISVAKKDALVNRSEYAARAYGVDNYGYAKVICGEGLIGEIALNGDFFVISNKVYNTNDDGDDGYELTGFVNGEETTIFAEIGEVEVQDFTGVAADGKTAETTYSSIYDLSKGDVILYSRTVNGDADRIIRLVDAESLKDSSTANGLKEANGGLVVAQFDAAGDDYSFYYGFAYGRSGNILKLSAKGEWDEYDDVTTMNVSAKSDVAGASVDLFQSKTKVVSATADDINCDMTGDGCGDMVFIRTYGDTLVEDIVIFKCNE